MQAMCSVTPTSPTSYRGMVRLSNTTMPGQCHQKYEKTAAMSMWDHLKPSADTEQADATV